MNSVFDLLSIIPFELSVLILLILGFGFLAILFYLYKAALKLLIKMVLFAAVSFIALFALMAYMFWIEPSTIHTTYTQVDGSDPMKIVFVADIHSWSISEEYLNEVIVKINSEKPDYILLGGDFINGVESEIPKLGLFKNLSAKKGVYAVLGNHDYNLGEPRCAGLAGIALSEKIESKLNESGIQVLRNENVQLSNSTVLVGLDDYWACQTNYSKAVKGSEGYDTKMLLTHNQEAIPTDKMNNWNLMLVGHTHCGQIRLPIIGSIPKLLGFKGEYDAGYYRLGNNSSIYNSCGIGGGPRFLAPPEITVIEIK
jgi:predicted MPP superfamily phosphohydrolase